MQIDFQHGKKPVRWPAEALLKNGIVHVFSTIGVHGMGNSSNELVASLPSPPDFSHLGASLRKALSVDWAVVSLEELGDRPSPELTATGAKSLKNFHKKTGNLGVVWCTDLGTFVLSTFRHSGSRGTPAKEYTRTLPDQCSDSELGRVAFHILDASRWLNDPTALDLPDDLNTF